MHKLKGVVTHLARKISSPRFHGVIPTSHLLLIRPHFSTNSDSASLELKAQAKAWNMMFTFINSMSLRCAVQLGVADVIHRHGGTMSAAQLAGALPIHPSKAHHMSRLMRLLVHSGLFAGDEGAYALTDASRLLLSDNPHSVSSFVSFILSPDMTKPWHHLAEWFQSEDAAAFVTCHNIGFWDFGRSNTGLFSVFGDAMARDSRLVVRMLVGQAEFMEVFEGVGTVVDVGGGTGTVAKAVAAEFPATECIVYDLPHVVAGLEGSRNVKFVGGDMFEAVPSGDIVLLKWILHDWSDEESVKILEQCRKAITTSPSIDKKVKVIVIDMVVQTDCDDRKVIETQFFYDLEMMVFFNGRERSEKEWAKLFSKAGFSRYKITPGLGMKSLIEVYP